MNVTELVFADVHQLLGRDELGVSASLGVRLGLAGPAERLKGRIIDELRVLDDLNQNKKFQLLHLNIIRRLKVFF